MQISKLEWGKIDSTTIDKQLKKTGIEVKDEKILSKGMKSDKAPDIHSTTPLQ